MEQKPHVNLVILTPGHSMMASYVSCLLQTIQFFTHKKISITWMTGYSSHVADAREICLSGTKINDPSNNIPFEGNFTYDKLMWIDSDIDWNPEDVLKLYESDKDIISGAYMLATGEVTAYKELLRSPYVFDEIKALTEPVEVYSVGFGFVCIKAGVFESMSRPWFQQVEATITRDSGTFTFPIMGEDISFCHRAKSIGFEVWLDPSVRVVHNKMMKLTWDGPQPA